MSTFLEAAQAQRMVKISTDPQATARQISAQQFRPTKEQSNGTQQRESEPEHTNGR
jgi:hypothetical protein